MLSRFQVDLRLKSSRFVTTWSTWVKSKKFDWLRTLERTRYRTRKIWGIKKSDLMILARGSSQENGFAVFTPPSSSLQHQPSFLWSQRFRVTPLTVAGLRQREMLGCLEKTESWFQIQFSVLYEEHDWNTFFSVLQQKAFAQCSMPKNHFG